MTANSLMYYLHTVDQLSVSITSNINPDEDNLMKFTVGERATVNFTAIASGINKHNFVYKWKRKGNKAFPDKVSNVSRAVLTIPNVLESDKGKYYCTVTNEWGSTEQSSDVTLAIKGRQRYTVHSIVVSCICMHKSPIVINLSLGV